MQRGNIIFVGQSRGIRQRFFTVKYDGPGLLPWSLQAPTLGPANQPRPLID